jgi:hypothetical protein
MLYYLIKRGNDFGMAYVTSWGPTPGSRMRFLYYDELPQHQELPGGTYIFSDLERLTQVEREMAVQMWVQLSQAGDRVRLLNDPARVLGRYDLLRMLHEKGENLYRVSRLGKSACSLHFPVFLKYANEHGHALPDLLGSPAEIESAVRYLKWRGRRPQDLFIAEFCDTASESGVFRKYSAFIVGERILPRHLFFSRRWIVKKPDLADPDFALQQERYLEENPHESWLRHIFLLAGIRYGRIDYGFLGEVPQVWEINTNPTVHKMTPRLTSALEAIDCEPEPGGRIPMTWDPCLVRSLDRENRRDRRKLALSKAAEGLLSSRLYKGLARFARIVRPNRWYQA